MMTGVPGRCALIAIGFCSAAPAAAEPGCPVTDPTTSAVDVPWTERHHLEHDRVWYGSEALAVLLSPDGNWHGMGPDHDYGDKLWLWSADWDRDAEPEPALTVVAVGLRDPSLTSEADAATHGYSDYWEAMLTGLGFPAPGCWEVHARYRDASVSFVVLVD